MPVEQIIKCPNCGHGDQLSITLREVSTYTGSVLLRENTAPGYCVDSDGRQELVHTEYSDEIHCRHCNKTFKAKDVPALPSEE